MCPPRPPPSPQNRARIARLQAACIRRFRLRPCASGMRMLIAISLTNDQQGWVALVIAMMAIGYLLFRPRFKKKDPLEKPAFGSLAAQRSVERQMQNLLVELSEMARQMNAQVDTRATKLQELIKQ